MRVARVVRGDLRIRVVGARGARDETEPDHHSYDRNHARQRRPTFPTGHLPTSISLDTLMRRIVERSADDVQLRTAAGAATAFRVRGSAASAESRSRS